MSPPSRLGQAYLSPQGWLYLVVSDPWQYGQTEAAGWRHDLVAFAAGSVHRFHRDEDTVAELEDRPGWTRLT